MTVCPERDIRIVQDISVTGFSDISVAKHLDPPLTTVREPTADIGSMAAELLVRQIEGREIPGNKINLLPGRFIPRGSTVARK